MTPGEYISLVRPMKAPKIKIAEGIRDNNKQFLKKKLVPSSFYAKEKPK